MTFVRSLLQQHVKSLGKQCSMAQQNELLERCRKLEVRITVYEHRISVIVKSDDDINWTQDGHMGSIDMEMPDELSDISPDGWFTPETERIMLPSNLAEGEIDHLSLGPLATIECELQKGQVMEALDGLCLALGEKSLCFRQEVCNVDSQRTMHWAWDNVHTLDAEAWKWRSTYRRVHNALLQLSNDSDCLEGLLDITDEDLKVVGDLTDERQVGQRLDTIPWFWRMWHNINTSGPGMQECKLLPNYGLIA